MKRNVEMTVEQARVLFNDPQWKSIILNSFTEEELFPVKTWKDILMTYEGSTVCYTVNGSEIKAVTVVSGVQKYSQNWKNSLPNAHSAEKILALCQIALMADYYNKIAIKDKETRYKYFAKHHANTDTLSVDYYGSIDVTMFPFTFYKREHLEEAITANPEIFKTALK